MVVINLRGGSGAGKSTVIRKIMGMYHVKLPHFVEGRKQPLWYDLGRHNAIEPVLRVLGHYEAECGGCDTISKNPVNPEETPMTFIHRLIREADEGGYNVLYEGVILSTINGDLLKMVQGGFPVTVINLTSDLETCLMGISERRLRKEGGSPDYKGIRTVQAVRAGLEEKTIKNNVGKLKSAYKTAHQLRVAGATVIDCDRETAVGTIAKLLGL